MAQAWSGNGSDVGAALTWARVRVAIAQFFPKRTFDVGIAEQHAVTFAAGMAVDQASVNSTVQAQAAVVPLAGSAEELDAKLANEMVSVTASVAVDLNISPARVGSCSLLPSFRGAFGAVAPPRLMFCRNALPETCRCDLMCRTLSL